jgi:glutaminyl-peptide cyclotransferase
LRASLRQTAFLVLVVTVLVGCDRLDQFLTLDAPVERLVTRVVSVRPHDPNAFTEGLLLADGYLYESTGRNGQSSLREVDPETGEVLRGVRLPAEFFGEGIALVGDRIFQLTWLEGVGFIFDRDTFALVDTFPYTAEGWGMCYDGEHLYTSDGSPVITQRDPETLAALATVTVSLEDEPVEEINELECVDESIYANVWHTDYVLRIDKASGRVTAVVDATSLLTPEQRSTLGSEATLNGIAYDAEQGTFLLTGKLWSWLFEVEFVAAS